MVLSHEDRIIVDYEVFKFNQEENKLVYVSRIKKTDNWYGCCLTPIRIAIAHSIYGKLSFYEWDEETQVYKKG